jgi:chemotaxis protein CheC
MDRVDLRSLDAAQLDGLRELANIGAGHAATALSQLMHRRVMITVPEATVLRLAEVDRLAGDPSAPVAAVIMKILGDVTGRMLQVFPADAAARLAAAVLGTGLPSFPDEFDELHRSALMEVGNIIVGAHLNALSDFMGMLLIMSTPDAAVDMAGAVLTTSYLNFGNATDEVFCLNTELLVDDARITGHFLLIPDDVSLPVILRQLRLA